jgi:outer membrane protein assembly factor BamB
MTRLLTLLLLASRAFATDVVRHHNTPERTGGVLDETILSPATLKSRNFGRLFSLVVDGQVYAQPLVLSQFDMPGKGPKNVVFLATMRNMVYAYDADGHDAEPFWKKSLGGPMPFDRIPKDGGAELGQYNIRPYIGIASTPVIDRDNRRMYVVAKIAEPACPGLVDTTPTCPVQYRIFALDIRNGDILNSAAIQIPTDDLKIPATDAARRHLQRAALLLANGRVYAAFGAHQDAKPFQGWLMSFDPETLSLADPVFCTTRGGEMGGIWQAGSGPAVDDKGNLYFMTGNGTFDAGRQFGNSLVKMNAALSPIGWFTPDNEKALTLLDIDLGSAGPLLLPDTNQVLGGGKQGRLYLVDRDTQAQQPHHWWRAGTNPPVQYFQASRPWRITWLSWFPLLFNIGYHHIHGSPVYWNGPKGPMIYVWPEEDNVRAYRYDAAQHKFDTHPIKGMKGNQGMPGGFLSISANGREDGILWAAIPAQDDAWVEIVRGAMRAFRADTLELLWSTDVNDSADHFDFAKNVPPTIANGKVYLATFSDRVNVYGLDSQVAAAAQPAPKLSRNSRHRGHIKGATGHGAH